MREYKVYQTGRNEGVHSDRNGIYYVYHGSVIVNDTDGFDEGERLIYSATASHSHYVLYGKFSQFKEMLNDIREIDLLIEPLRSKLVDFFNKDVYKNFFNDLKDEERKRSI